MRTNGKKWGMLAACIVFFAAAIRWRTEIITILSVFSYAAGFIIVLSPLCRYLESKGVKPALASGLCILLLIMIVLLFVSVLFPYIVHHCILFLKKNHSVLLSALEGIEKWSERCGFAFFRWNQFFEILMTQGTQIIAQLAQTGFRAAGMAGKCVFAVAIAYYGLQERKKAGNHLMMFLPFPCRRAAKQILIGSKNAVMGYFSGVMKTSLFVFGGTYIGLILLRIPDALLLSVMMGILEILPYLGPVLASIPILLSAIPMGFERTILTLFLVFAVQLLEGNLVGPYFAAASTSIHPLAALIGVFVMGTCFGFWGVLLAIPVFVTVRSVIWSVLQFELDRKNGTELICARND